MKDDIYDACAWGSHLPALLACLADTVGPVLEIGVGHFSTPALHAFCVRADRQLVSVESNPEWFQKFATRFTCKNHTFLTNTAPVLSRKDWAVVLIDDSPGGQNRANHFSNFIQGSIYVVVHDYHLDNEWCIYHLLKGCNVHVTKTYQPPTLVASLMRTVPDSILCL